MNIMNNQNLAQQALEESDRSDQFAETLQSLEQVIERNANQMEEIKDELKKSHDRLIIGVSSEEQKERIINKRFKGYILNQKLIDNLADC